MSKQWPAVIITKGIPDHPEGAIRFPRRELRERWEKMGICRLATETDVKTDRRRVLSIEANRDAAPEVVSDPVPRSKRRRR